MDKITQPSLASWLTDSWFCSGWRDVWSQVTVHHRLYINGQFCFQICQPLSQGRNDHEMQVGVAEDSSGKKLLILKRREKRLTFLLLQPLGVMSRALTAFLTPSSHKENNEQRYTKNSKPERQKELESLILCMVVQKPCCQQSLTSDM